MNDSFSGKNGKVKVMYVRSGENSNDDRNHNNRGKNRHPAGKGRPGDNTGRSSSLRNNDSRRNDSGRPARSEGVGSYDSSWKTVSRAPSEAPAFDHGGISGKSHVDPAQLRRQRAEETRVYGENACKALFESRPDAIVRAWFVQSVTPRFREALKWMAANRKAYHVVEEDELAKASGTEHHGGVCFLIKKRQGLDAETYLQQQIQAKDCVLALEDVGNPHNLGGIMRTCAHF
ncbi:MAG: tRNA/rRNA methyltransferase, partial [Yersinia sp. (in: enterobacteria)]